MYPLACSKCTVLEVDLTSIITFKMPENTLKIDLPRKYFIKQKLCTK